MRRAATGAGEGPSNRQLLLWTMAAAVNVASAFAVFRRTDFETLYRWTSAWLIDGVNLYGSLDWATDYPPTAIVVLSPLAALPLAFAAWLWAVLNVGLAVVAAFLAARSVRADVSWRQVALLALTFICWSATRSLLQFSLLALVFGLAGWRLADERPWLSGVLLGLATMKPQVALPYCLWAALTRRWRVAPAAVLTTAALWGTYSLRVGASPLNVALGYARTLEAMYSGPQRQTGVSELARLAPAGWADAWTGAVGVAFLFLLLFVTRQTARGRAAGRTGIDMQGLPGAIAAAVLVTFRHLSYAFVTLLPASAFLLLGDLDRSWPPRRTLFWALQVGLIIDVPTAYRAALGWGFSAGFAEGFFLHFDRGLLLVWAIVLLLTPWQVVPPLRISLPRDSGESLSRAKP